MTWFESAGVWGWVIVVVAMSLVAAAVVAAMVRVTRIVALLLLVCCGAPALVGVVGMTARSGENYRVVNALNAPTPKDLVEARDDARSILFLGLGAMLTCDVAAVVALLRSKPPER